MKTLPQALRPLRAPRPARRGLTLIELSIGTFIAVFLTAAAVAFATHETRLMGVSREQLDISQSGRAAIDLLARDLAGAGAGVGYRSNGAFGGLMVGPFTVGGLAFNPDGAAPNAASPLSLPSVALGGAQGASFVSRSLDVGILVADGSYSTVAAYDRAGTGQFCVGPDERPTEFRATELAVLRDASRMAARSVVVSPGAVAPCSQNRCVHGCRAFTFVDAPAWFQTDGAVDQVNYVGGELAGSLRAVVWFIALNGERGTLQRAVFDNTRGCDARDAECGATVADFAESLQMVVYSWDADTSSWVNAQQTPVSTGDRIRVDVELVLRTRAGGERVTAPVPLQLQPGVCVPDCNAPDAGIRRAFRTSVEIKNSGV